MFESAEYEPTETDRLSLSRERFLTSHRAIGACAREFGRLAEEFVDRAETVGRDMAIEEKPELRLTPDRCVVQIGPVALSIAWLRGPLDSLADGRLLVIAWRGTITRRRFSEAPIRANTSQAAIRTAVTVWEETFLASAESETSWHWQSETHAAESYTSAELAERCIAKACAAWQLQRTA